jgi:glycosyltransferase involved in cell wall biosynthesis
MKTIVIQHREAAALMPMAGLAVDTPVPVHAASVDRRPCILHFTYSTGGGGAESMLVNLVENTDTTRFRTVVVAVNARPWPEAAHRLHRAGARLYDLEGTAFLKRETLFKLRAAIHAERPDIMQTWMHHADFVGGWAARIAGVKKVLWGIHCREIHRNPEDSALKTAFFRLALRLSSKFIPTHVISCSAAAIEDHVKMGYPRRKMRWIPNGIDAERFVPSASARAATRAELDLPEDAPVIGYAGRFHEMKDLATFFRAAAELQHRVPEAHFVFCGGSDVELGAEEREALTLIPNRSQVRFVAFRADPWRLYPALDIFSLSSRTEACPMTIMEAMACGVPCITTDVGDCDAMLDAVGATVPARDHAALAAAWDKVLQIDDATRAELARISRQRVLERFTVATAARQYEETWSQMLGVRA